MKHISLNVQEQIKNVLHDTLEKDLTDDEIICPLCHGLGIVKQSYPFGIKDENKTRLNWYDNQSVSLCPRCNFGVVKVCKYCGKPLPKLTNKCDCKEYKKYEKEEKRIKYQETIKKAKEVDVNSVSAYLYDEKTDSYFAEIKDFVDKYKDSLDFKNDKEMLDNLPEVLWICEEIDISMDDANIIEDACEELHEDAYDSISGKDIDELQNFLDKWCGKQTGTNTCFPSYKEYIKVKEEWFD